MKKVYVFLIPMLGLLLASSVSGRADQVTKVQPSTPTCAVSAPPPAYYVAPAYYYPAPAAVYYGPPPYYYRPRRVVIFPRVCIGFHCP